MPNSSPRTVAQRWTEVDNAHCLLRRVSKTLDAAARAGGWSVQISPIRFLVLAHLHHVTAFGLTPKRLAWLLRVPPPSLAYHLDALENADLIHRRPRDLHDGRAVTVRLTVLGEAAYLRLGAQELRERS